MTCSSLTCIKCKSNKLWKAGFYKNMQIYRCKSCRKEFTKLSRSKYSRHRYPKRVILTAIMLYRYGLSSCAISEVLRKRFRIEVSAWTVCKWARKFGDIRELHKYLGIRFGRIWHADEMFIKANNRMNYLYAVIDNNSNVIALHVSEHRDKQSAITVLRKAQWIAGRPDIIVSDEWSSYLGAIRKVFGWHKPKVRHVQAHFEKKLIMHNRRWYALSNNHIEGWNSWFRRIYSGMRGFKSITSMQQFLDIYGVLWNLKDKGWEFLANL